MLPKQMSRLEYALRECVTPGTTVEIHCVDSVTANATFERICDLIPAPLIKRYGLSHVEFENGSKISVTVTDRAIKLPFDKVEMRIRRRKDMAHGSRYTH
jgi:hypothetical protein